ncbi:MAG: methyltransferase domain-containing protein [Candidatus Nanoarchaeia archaeon]|nr:methyltransferase domain-containing protein [Candidatus Nanoarchaeia archaeon]MDD5587625.1 methyltransferase domain-containing protein [Candidatus Nanoarchaeia archaeon]
MKNLNLGSGKDYKQGFINLDYNKQYRADVYHDINKIPYPFKKEEFDYVYCSHILEHVDDLFKTLDELLRITKVNGKIHIKVPHFSNGNGYNDLSHKRFFGWFTFKQIQEGYYNKKFNFKIEKQRFNFLSENHPILNKLCSWKFNILPKQFYERFLCWIFPVGEIEIELIKL